MTIKSRTKETIPSGSHDKPRSNTDTFRDRCHRYTTVDQSEISGNCSIVDAELTFKDYMNYISHNKLDSKASCLDFWKRNQDRWPILREIAR